MSLNPEPMERDRPISLLKQVIGIFLVLLYGTPVLVVAFFLSGLFALGELIRSCGSWICGLWDGKPSKRNQT